MKLWVHNWNCEKNVNHELKLWRKCESWIKGMTKMWIMNWKCDENVNHEFKLWWKCESWIEIVTKMWITNLNYHRNVKHVLVLELYILFCQAAITRQLRRIIFSFVEMIVLKCQIYDSLHFSSYIINGQLNAASVIWYCIFSFYVALH